MTTSYQNPSVIRSALFVPGHREDLLPKALAAHADCLFLDLEDGVSEGWKTTARESVRRMLSVDILRVQNVFVRVNSLQTGLVEADLEAAACRNLRGFVVPQVDEALQIRALEVRLKEIELRLDLPVGHFLLIALIESPRGVLNAAEVAASSDRMAALFFGCEDFLAALQGRHNEGETALLTPRAIVVMAARAACIEAIDAPFVRVHDLKGLRRFAHTGRDLGFGGMCALSPRQVPVIHEIYTPNALEIRHARMVIEAHQKSQAEGRGVMIEEETFVSPPTVRAAKKLIERAEAIIAFEKRKLDDTRINSGAR